MRQNLAKGVVKTELYNLYDATSRRRTDVAAKHPEVRRPAGEA